MFQIQGVANQLSRLTGIEFRHAGATTSEAAVYLQAGGWDARRMRVDNCKFDHMGTSSIRAVGVIGTIDHNQFYGTPTATFIYSFDADPNQYERDPRQLLGGSDQLGQRPLFVHGEQPL